MLEDPPKAFGVKMQSSGSSPGKQLPRAQLWAVQYTLMETSHDTVARYIEWAYKGDYTEVTLILMSMPQTKQLNDTSESSQLEPTIDEYTALQAHTLLCHL